ncbi:hypothetical protein [Actinomadura roseirufa]|uniref:hypothetical protein n=1 Tax=Actinomadura roseirufa TaxID=2094049 RepID=UPI001A955F67|nr:hypothetical protein [Actinomadura roseirufa]
MGYVEFERRGSGAGRSGVFVAWELLAWLGIAAAAFAAAVLAVLVPAAAAPVGVAAGVAGVLLAVRNGLPGGGAR